MQIELPRWSDFLRDAIRRSGKTKGELAKLSGVDQMVISRFLSGERDIRLETADKLVAALRFNEFWWVLHLVKHAEDWPDYAVKTAWRSVENSIPVGIQNAAWANRSRSVPSGASLDDCLDYLTAGKHITKATGRRIQEMKEEYEAVLENPTFLRPKQVEQYVAKAFEVVDLLWQIRS